ncbi:hypothetical protein FPOA_10338 [Fusarium poae]|uniref:Uncharacterized protein n=1 Tax=Fusarium poae TaxID=36050 RepID=A0A1B8ADR3_FUSPO|nr:hypothetical protein FPOA_10338 [Fusarium poae]
MIFNRFALNVTHLLRVVRLHSRRGLVCLCWRRYNTHFESLCRHSTCVLHSPFELLVISANSLRFISTIFKPVAAASIRRDKSPRSRQHIIAIQPLELNDQASLAVPERISACPMNY